MQNISVLNTLHSVPTMQEPEARRGMNNIQIVLILNKNKINVSTTDCFETSNPDKYIYMCELYKANRLGAISDESTHDKYTRVFQTDGKGLLWNSARYRQTAAAVDGMLIAVCVRYVYNFAQMSLCEMCVCARQTRTPQAACECVLAVAEHKLLASCS